MTDQQETDFLSKFLEHFGSAYPDSFVRKFAEKIFAAPTQGADARPVADSEIRDVIARLAPTAKFAGNHGDRQAATDAIRMLATLGDALAVLATRDAEQSELHAFAMPDLPKFPPQDFYAADKPLWDTQSMRKFAHAYADLCIAASAPREKT